MGKIIQSDDFKNQDQIIEKKTFENQTQTHFLKIALTFYFFFRL